MTLRFICLAGLDLRVPIDPATSLFANVSFFVDSRSMLSNLEQSNRIQTDFGTSNPYSSRRFENFGFEPTRSAERPPLNGLSFQLRQALNSRWFFYKSVTQ